MESHRQLMFEMTIFGVWENALSSSFIWFSLNYAQMPQIAIRQLTLAHRNAPMLVDRGTLSDRGLRKLQREHTALISFGTKSKPLSSIADPRPGGEYGYPHIDAGHKPLESQWIRPACSFPQYAKCEEVSLALIFIAQMARPFAKLPQEYIYQGRSNLWHMFRLQRDAFPKDFHLCAWVNAWN